MTSTDHPDAVPPSQGPRPVEPEVERSELPNDLPMSTAEAEALEESLRAALDRSLRRSVDEDMAAWEAKAGSREEGKQFADAVHAAWIADLRHETDDFAPNPLVSVPAAQDRSQTALLGPNKRTTESSPFAALPSRSFLSEHPWTSSVAALAAAALLAVALRTDPTTGPGEASRDAAEHGEAPVYLGPGSDPATEGTAPEAGEGSRLDVSLFPFLPESVDFEEHVPKVGPFKVRVTRLGEEARIDESPFEATYDVYEPRWSCPPADRSNLPQLIQLEIRQGMDVPGSSALWTTFFRTR